MQSPKVSIISVNYNQAAVTEDMLKSIEQLSFRDYEVIVVDNGSKESLSEFLGGRYPSTVLIESEANLGFSGGNNLGIDAARGEYLFFVNNDTELVEGSIETLLAFFEKNPKAGLVSPLIVYHTRGEQGQEVLQYAGMTSLHPITGRNVKVGQYEDNKGQYKHPMQTGYAHGAAMMMPRTVLEKVGPMPLDFFLYYEEMDWSQQVTNAGFEVWVEPAAKIYHKESITTGKMGALKTYFTNRNRILFMRRNASVLGLVGFYAFLFFIAIPKNTIHFLLKGDFETLKAFYSGILWNFFPNDSHPFEQLATNHKRKLVSSEVSI